MNVLAIGIFVVTYGLASSRTVAGLGVSRAVITSVGAALCLFPSVLGPTRALAALNHDVLLLLLGVMGMGAFLRIHGVFVRLERRLDVWSPSPSTLLALIVWGSGALSALITNDAVCLLGAPLVLRLIEVRRLQPLPFLLALATASNTGSVATLVGNPQNMLVGELGGIEYLDYLRAALPVAVAGLAINHAVLLIWLRRRPERGATDERGGSTGSGFTGDHATQSPSLYRRSADNPGHAPQSATKTKRRPQHTSESSTNITERPQRPSEISLRTAETRVGPGILGDAPDRRGGRPWLPLAVIASTAVCYTFGTSLEWTAIAGFAVLVAANPRRLGEAWRLIDWSLLVFFAGLFVVVEAFNQSGVTGWFFSVFSLATVHAQPAGDWILGLFYLFGSNVVSNVPFILVIREQLASLPDADYAWTLLAMVSSLAGNLTFLGSAANVIVAESSRTVGGFGFWDHLRVGFPIALATSAVAVGWMILQQ